ncbi:PEP-CTERM protein-sorting domain-containing protein [Duganella sacchari]|uniref:PEP-CTERM protein-sorting domain-containing protein n=1 Tax=Duganella sacchari TaxID=551987 RepID=A0A1M7REH3_9BURK|nr:FxDxF family PEP-CTERM protein [Duganella sacchari]SHN44683.1 PEP-CTERM protein-sorting domain-containing protein [Duganella sacchari]
MPIVLPKSASAIQFLLIAALPMGMATAADFPGTITGASTKAQTLAGGQSGTVAATGSLIVSGKDNAVTIGGANVTLTNNNILKQTGTGRVIRDSVGYANLTVNNNAGALMQAADADVIQLTGKSSVSLNNYGSMISLNPSEGGSQAVDFNGVTGSNVVNNYGLLKATEADAVRPGMNGVVNNYGTIQSVTPKKGSSDAIDLQTNATGVQVFNYATGLIEGGRHGITGGPDTDVAFTVAVTNAAGGIIRGINGSGINLDGFSGKQVLTLVNHGTITGQGVTGDGDGVDMDGIANITNTGIIRSIDAFAAKGETKAYSEGISVGGGTIINSGTIEGLVSAGNTVAVGRGITLAGNDVKGAPEGTREGLYGHAVITNQAGGVIRGQSDSAIVAVGAASGYTVTINNSAGASIIGGGAVNAAIKGGLDNTAIVTGGIINGSSSGKAIELGSGKNSVTITGGTILGSISGGSGNQNTLVVNPGTGGSFSYAGAIANFSKVEIKGGDVTFSGVSTYAGATQLSGGSLTLDGAQRLSADSALILNGGTLRLSNAGADGQHFASLSLTDDSAVLLGGSSLTFGSLGTVIHGKTLTFTEAAAGAYAFRLQGDYSSDASFLALIGATHINGLGATYAFDGIYTKVAAAVPEPEAYAMMFAGLALVGAIARRRRHKV